MKSSAMLTFAIFCLFFVNFTCQPFAVPNEQTLDKKMNILEVHFFVIILYRLPYQDDSLLRRICGIQNALG